MSDSGSLSPASDAESTSSVKYEVPSQSSGGYPGTTDFAAMTIEQCRFWLRYWRLPDHWPEDQVVARCLLYRINLSRRHPYATRANFARCQELFRYPVSELREVLGSHGFVAKKPDKSRIVYRILRAERHERKRARKAYQKRMEAQKQGHNPSERTPHVYSSDFDDTEDDDDDTSTDESTGWTDEKDRYIEVVVPEGEDFVVEVEEGDDNDDGDDDDSEDGEERGNFQSSSFPATRPRTARKTPVASASSRKRARTPDEETDDEIDPPSPKRIRAASSSATSCSNSDEEESDHEYAEDSLATQFAQPFTGSHKRKRDEHVNSASGGEERSPKRAQRVSNSGASGLDTSSQSAIAKRARCNILKHKSSKKATASGKPHTPVAEGVARKKPKTTEQVTSSGVAFIPIADGIARLKTVAREQVTSSGVSFIPVAAGIARLAPVCTEPASDNEDDESSNDDARSIGAEEQEPGEEENDEKGYEGEDEDDEEQDDEEGENEDPEEEEYQDFSSSRSQSPVQRLDELSSRPTHATKSPQAHVHRTGGKEPIAVESVVDTLKRKRADKLEDSSPDSDEPLIKRRRRFQRPATPGQSNGASTTASPTLQARGTVQSSNPTVGHILQEQRPSMIIGGVDTSVLFENKKSPISILNAMLRIMMGCPEENDEADVYQSRKNLPGYRAYLEGSIRAADDEDNDWLTAQKAFEVREMDAIIAWESESDSDGDSDA